MPFVKFTKTQYTKEEFASRDLESVEGREVVARLAQVDAGYSNYYWSDTPIMGYGDTVYRGHAEFRDAILATIDAMLKDGVVGDEVSEFVELGVTDVVFVITLSLHEGDNV